MAGVESKCISIIEQRRHPFVFSSMGRDAFSWKSSLLRALTRRLAAYSPLRDIEFEFEPDLQPTNANVGAERLDDILTDLIEGMAGIGVKHIRIVTEVSPGRVAIGLSSRERIDPAAFGKRRFSLYNRTLGWLGGGLECRKQDGNAEFLIRLPALEAV